MSDFILPTTLPADFEMVISDRDVLFMEPDQSKRFFGSWSAVKSELVKRGYRVVVYRNEASRTNNAHCVYVGSAGGSCVESSAYPPKWPQS